MNGAKLLAPARYNSVTTLRGATQWHRRDQLHMQLQLRRRKAKQKADSPFQGDHVRGARVGHASHGRLTENCTSVRYCPN